MVPATEQWLDQVAEPIIDPELEIVDAHHHLWPPGHRLAYDLTTLRADTGSGHNVVKTVFVECHASYRTDGPEHLRPVGETEFVAERAARLRADAPGVAPIAAVVAHADLRDGRLDEVLDGHGAAAPELFRGIRHAAAHEPDPGAMMHAGRAPADLYADPAFRDGVRRLGERGLTFDAWHHHHQLADFTSLARAGADTVMVLDHFGGPMGVGPYAGRHDEIFRAWATDIAEVARCDNVVAKLGGMAMPDNGFGWHVAERPPTSDEFVVAQRRWYDHTIECFGPERCLFESNFPVDRLSLSYPVLWNAFKKLTAAFSPGERAAMFSGTATRVYRL